MKIDFAACSSALPGVALITPMDRVCCVCSRRIGVLANEGFKLAGWTDKDMDDEKTKKNMNAGKQRDRVPGGERLPQQGWRDEWWTDPGWMVRGGHALNAFRAFIRTGGGGRGLDDQGSVTCMWGRGRPRAEGLVAGRPTLLLSSSRARVSCSNCTSCSLTDSSRAAALSHCSIHTTRPQREEGSGGG